ncbi:DUF6166 domain-containing protein [Natrarchaeobius oligotrophus]|uniref:Uncharacterized protein n=1 Tax=Natrarchaeobius chitinivorans TaxID=1679083 RepID=A0A3N6PIW2_NATCH|nr:DUF6166 domain-containing protein [Natrarchaeobius chitinivorans]RQG98305.1 hypothetical protein EA472_17995 [Natrarchaeobius chitinivorans]
MSRDVGAETQGPSTQSTAPRPSATTDSAETVYRGYRDPTAPVGEECTVSVDGEPLDSRHDLLSASRSGFEWGYGGSGPAQLAIALLAHAFNDEIACDHYQRFKRDVVAELPEEGWTLRAADLDTWYKQVSADA